MMNRIAAENICISDTTTRPRQDKYLFDYDSVNEAVVNAIVHNDWSISEAQISFFSNRLEILSHGSLPNNLSIDEFFAGISKPRNLALMKIFSDLDIVDHTGHGIPTIVEHYEKEVFNIQSTYILVSIPFDKEVLNKTNVGVNVVEKMILAELLNNPTLTADKLSLIIKKSKRTIERYLKALQEKGYIERSGSDKTGVWKIIK